VSDAAGAASPVPGVEQYDDPAGWLPVSFGNAQISVPPSWTLVTAGAAGCGSQAGVVVLGSGMWCPASMNDPPRPDTSVVSIRTLGTTEAGGHPLFSTHGIRVYGVGLTPVYVVPALDVEISESGPLQPQVLHTLTYSPRAVALGPGPRSVPRRGWRSISYAGLGLTVPPSWPVRRYRNAPSCADWVELPLSGVTLAAKSPLPVSCPLPPSAYEPAPQTQGLEVDDFWSGSRLSVCAGPRRIGGVRVCVDPSPAYGILVAEVFPPDHRPVTVQIGMAGDGTTGRAVLQSLR
jgi:hypothetical protein